MQTMIKGVYAPERFLEIFRDYIYFQDHEYNSDEKEIVCRYPQFFATRLLKQSIVKSVEEKNGKGGTYFGATGAEKPIPGILCPANFPTLPELGITDYHYDSRPWWYPKARGKSIYKK